MDMSHMHFHKEFESDEENDLYSAKNTRIREGLRGTEDEIKEYLDARALTYLSKQKVIKRFREKTRYLISVAPNEYYIYGAIDARDELINIYLSMFFNRYKVTKLFKKRGGSRAKNI